MEKVHGQVGQLVALVAPGLAAYVALRVAGAPWWLAVVPWILVNVVIVLLQARLPRRRPELRADQPAEHLTAA